MDKFTKFLIIFGLIANTFKFIQNQPINETLSSEESSSGSIVKVTKKATKGKVS